MPEDPDISIAYRKPQSNVRKNADIPTSDFDVRSFKYLIYN